MSAARNSVRAASKVAAVLPGFGPKTTTALEKVGVTTLKGLQTRDPYELYRDLKRNDPAVSLNFLYGILAAREGGDWREIQRTRKTEILLRLDEMGLAPR